MDERGQSYCCDRSFPYVLFVHLVHLVMLHFYILVHCSAFVGRFAMSFVLEIIESTKTSWNLCYDEGFDPQ